MIFSGLLLLAAFILAINIYNGLISLRNQVDRAWSNIDVILKQRHDELPQLISICEQFAGYERATIDRLVQARTQYGAARSISEKVVASGAVSSALSGLLAIGEAYPELKSSDQFNQIQQRISAIEEQLADRRELYNETVTNYNIRCQQFPDAIFANALLYKTLELFRVETHERTTPNLKMKLPK